MQQDFLELDGVGIHGWERFLALPGRARLPAAVRLAWERVRRLGASPEGPGSEAVVTHDELTRRREVVEPVLRVLPEVLAPAARAFAQRDHLLVLADPDGVVVHTSGGGSFTDEASRIRLIAGSSWGESLRGTNAIGTALAEQRPVTVNGAAHFARPNHAITCYAAPILDPYGEVLGVLDATSLVENQDRFGPVAVLATARAIEQAVRQRAYAALGPAERSLVERVLARFPGPALLVERPGRVRQANAAALQALAGALQVRPGSGGVLLEVDATTERLLGASWAVLAEVVRTARDRLRTPDGRFAVELEPVQDRRGRLLALVAFLEPLRARRTERLPERRPLDDAFGTLQGSDEQLTELRRRARRLAASRLPILLLAETGTGKEVLARCLHKASDRRDGPFVAVNCGALSPQLLESELFGYAPGAFTGANPQGAVGHLAAADLGTLLLDEVADMPPRLQVALLRFLEDGTYSRVGETRVRRADVRVLCATCRDLPERVADGRFRADLYYRIRGATLSLPPLRERTDVVELAMALLEQLVGDVGLDQAPPLSAAARAHIAQHTWPGNVRELKSALHHALVLGGEEDELDLHHFPDAPVQGSMTAPAASLEQAERDALERALDAAGGNVSAAARSLGVARSTVYRMMRRFER